VLVLTLNGHGRRIEHKQLPQSGFCFCFLNGPGVTKDCVNCVYPESSGIIWTVLRSSWVQCHIKVSIDKTLVNNSGVPKKKERKGKKKQQNELNLTTKLLPSCLRIYLTNTVV